MMRQIGQIHVIVFKVDGFYSPACKDLGMGGCGPGNPYHVRI